MNIGSPNFWFVTLGVFALTTLASGFYPAFFFSSRKPIDVLRGGTNPGGTRVLGRRILVTFQYCIAIILAIGVIVVYEQIEHVRKRNLGYDLENLVAIAANDQISKRYDAIKDELLKTGVVEAVTRSNEGIDADFFTDYVEWPGKQTTDKVQFSRVLAEYDFVKTVGMRIIAGRDFSPALKSDTASVLINETAAKIIGYEDPIGEKIKTSTGYKTIIGITEDVVRGSPFDQVQPSYIGTMGDFTHDLTIRLMNTKDLSAAMAKVNDVFKRLDPLNPVASWFVDENINYRYRDINFVGELAAIFTGLAIFLTCLGVVGMAAYTAEQKKKEIAIRKILGATVASVLVFLSNYFVRTAILSLVISSPIAWLALDSYLHKFHYRIEVPWWVIPVSGFLLLSITLLVVLMQTFRAAKANPVVGLRTE
jgi:ABC-type antimicrobial peptide transport system permease subunit